MIFLIFFPLIFFAVSFGILRLKSDKADENGKKTLKKTEKRIITLLPCLIGALLLLDAVPKSYMMNPDGRGVSAAAGFAVSLLTFAAAVSGSFLSPKVTAFLKKSAICAAALIAAEILIFNGKSFAGLRIDETISAENMLIPENAAVNEEGNIVISGETTLELNSLPENVNSMIIDAEQEVIVNDAGVENHGCPFEVLLSIKDDNFSEEYITYQHKLANGRDYDIQLSFKPYGKVRSMRLRFTSISNPVTIKSVRVLSALPFMFSYARYFILLAAILIIIAIKDFRLYAITYNRNSRIHFIAVEAMVLLCTLMSFCFTAPDRGPIEYNKDEKILADPYAMTLDAFEKGQVWLDMDEVPELAEMENPYDKSMRDNTGVHYEWDYAYYDGHYYCYFGATPTVSYYYPYYLLTGNVPSMEMAMNFFVTLAIFFMCTTMLSAIRLLKIKTNLLMLLTLMPAMVCAAGLVFLANDINRYHIAVAAGLCFVLMSLSTGMTACAVKNKITKAVLLFISGASIALCVGARPTISLCAAVLIPFFIDILINKKEKLVHRLLFAASFLVPLAAGAIIIMKYNAVRFGSPFEFGAVYQLTVSDIHANKLSLAQLPAALYHYFLTLPRPMNIFPFFEENFYVLDNYGSFRYIAPNFGVFSYPVILFGLLMLPESRANKTNAPADKRRRLFTAICVAVSVFVAWTDFCIGGSLTRYIFDFMPLMALAAMIGILRRAERPAENSRKYVLAAASAVLTVVFAFFTCFLFREGLLSERFPNLFEAMEDIIIFWQ